MKLEITVNVTVTHTGATGAQPQLDRIEANLNSALTQLEQIRMTDAQVIALLQAIDTATTDTANNLAVVKSNTDKVVNDNTAITQSLTTISAEIDTLLNGQGVSAAVSDALTALKDKIDAASAASLGAAANSQTASDAIDAQIPVLTAIASKGAGTPVPVPPPPPPPPPPTV